MQIYLSDHFLRQLKPHIKKFRGLKNDLIETLENFQPSMERNLGQRLYKVRLKSRDIPKGKSNSFRIIIFLTQGESIIATIAIYFKSERHSISEKEIEYHLSMVLSEIQAGREL